MIGYIYKTTNLITKLIYVGKHESTNFEPDKYLGSGIILTNEIKKQGKENFICELLDTADTLEELWEKEIFWINKLDARNRDVGYNIATGGKGGMLGRNHTQEARTKIAARKGWHHSTETKSKISMHHFGIKPTEEARKKLSESHKGIPSKQKGTKLCEATKLKISKTLTGRKVPEEVIKKSAVGHMKKIICIETQEVFSSITEVYDKLNVQISRCLGKQVNTAGGYHWAYCNDLETIDSLKIYIGKQRYSTAHVKLNFTKISNEKEVLCVETNEIFKSLSEVARSKNIAVSKISQVCKGRRKTADGYHWELINKELN